VSIDAQGEKSLKGLKMDKISSTEVEYQSLRDTIGRRGSARMFAILGGLAAWGALAIAVLVSNLDGVATFVPLLVLAGTFEISFFVHTGIERVGRYLQVFHEEPAGWSGWETAAMHYGAKFPSGLDPLFSTLFGAAAALNLLGSIGSGHRRPEWIALSLAAHLAFAFRIVSARRRARSQRALDLDRFRNLLSN
jgi:hypothetical protein